jgi:hypothetical protein
MTPRPPGLGALQDNRNHPGWWRTRKLRSPVYRWFLFSPLRPPFVEICRFPHRIVCAAQRLPETIGVPTPCPDEFERGGLRELFLYASSECIRQLMRRYRWWGHLDTLVAVESFRLGAIFGARSSDRCTHYKSQQDQESATSESSG